MEELKGIFEERKHRYKGQASGYMVFCSANLWTWGKHYQRVLNPSEHEVATHFKWTRGMRYANTEKSKKKLFGLLRASIKRCLCWLEVISQRDFLETSHVYISCSTRSIVISLERHTAAHNSSLLGSVFLFFSPRIKCFSTCVSAS